jgi:transposase
MSTLLDIIENLPDVSLWALDEAGKRLESDNYYSWSPIGQPTVIERNGSKKGINIIGATEITEHFHFIYDEYIKDENSDGIICSSNVIQFLVKLLDYDSQRGIKKTFVILDNARFHTSEEVKKFARDNENKLILLFQPVYSPELNPQENIWNWMKRFKSGSTAYRSVEDLANRIKDFHYYLVEHIDEVRGSVSARLYYK